MQKRGVQDYMVGFAMMVGAVFVNFKKWWTENQRQSPGPQLSLEFRLC